MFVVLQSFEQLVVELQQQFLLPVFIVVESLHAEQLKHQFLFEQFKPLHTAAVEQFDFELLLVVEPLHTLVIQFQPLHAAPVEQFEQHRAMRLLALCHPTFNRKLHTCGNGNGFVYLGTNEILRRLEERGHPVDLVSLYQPLSLPLFGGRQLKCMQDVKPEAYDAYLHMFKDPTEPEVLDMLRAWKLPPKPAINDAFKLKDHGKWKYLPILQKAGLAPEIAGTPEAVAWKPSAANQSISADGKFINCAAFNNDRNIYPERRSLERIVIRFVDNATGGMRSIFRIGYVLGRFTMGWLYLAPAAQYIIKSGNAAHMVPFELPRRYREPLGRAMKEVGVDCCHVEGCFKHDRLFVFDLNPLPTSSGVTMSLLTEELVEQMIERLGEIVEGKNHE